MILLDTNVLVSAILFGGRPRRLLKRVLRGEFELVTSVELLDEFEDVLLERFGFERALVSPSSTRWLFAGLSTTIMSNSATPEM